MNYRIEINNTYGSKEIYFNERPGAAVRDSLKGLKFRWNKNKSCWYGFAEEEQIIKAIEGKPTEPKASAKTDEQKQLKELFKSELKKAWADDSRMVDYCTKKAAYIIEHNGKLYEIKKPSIKTSFCFGAGMYATCTDEEQAHASAMCEVASTNEDYFITENTRDLDAWIKQLEDIKEQLSWNWADNNYPTWMLSSGRKYSGQTEDCKLYGFWVVRSYNATETEKAGFIFDVELIDKLIEGYKVVKSDFVKRLNTYLKRYGLSKINTWSYIRD